jgi:hypothetical protein
MHRKTFTIAAVAALLAVPATAQAAPKDNAIQPSPAYFGKVEAGTHPTKTLTVTNRTSRNQYIRKFILAGAGGGKFTLTWRHATCRLGMNLQPKQSCTVVVRVVTTMPEYWETNLQINYGPRLLARPKRGQWNGFIFANVVAP